MLQDLNHRAALLEVLMAGGLTVIGFATGQGPLFALAGAAAGGVGVNWITTLSERAFQQWSANWLTERGVLQQDIIEALLVAFQRAIKVIDHTWKHHPHYLALQRANAAAAQVTLNPLRWLSEDATHLLQKQPKGLVLALQRSAVSALLHQDEHHARQFLTDKVGEYLFDHDAVLVDLIKSRLADEWLLQFGIVLSISDERGTRAWRAYQRLWQASLDVALDQLGGNTSEALTIVRWLQAWAERLERSPRDATGAEALEQMLHPVRLRLDEIKMSVGRVETGVERIEAKFQWIEREVVQGKARSIPFLAPPSPSHKIIGREIMLHDLKQHLFAGKALTLTALDGLPGVGKTTLAIALAHDPEVQEHFSEGVLWAGLGKEAQSADVLTHLGIWATALGISQAELEKLPDLRTRQQRIQAAIGQRKMLLIIDDVWNVAAALHLKLGGDNCAYLVTTRFPAIAEQLTAGESVQVRELSREDGLRLLEQFAPEAVQDASDEARALVQAVGELPLAITLMGKYLRSHLHHQQTLQQRKRRLSLALNQLNNAKERLKLEQPQGGLEQHPSFLPGTPLSLRASVAISYEALERVARRMLHSLSIFPAKPNSFSEDAALAVSAESAEVLDALTDAGLVESSGQDRHMLHQTIVDYASTKRTDIAAERRMAEYFVRYIEAHKFDYSILEQETSNVFTALQIAARQDMQAIFIRGVNGYIHFLDTRGMYDLAGDYLKQAQAAAISLEDTVGLVTTLLHLGGVAQKCGDYTQAEAYFQEGLVLARQISHTERISALLLGLGVVAGYRGDYVQVEEYLQEALVLARQIGHTERISHLLLNVGTSAANRGDHAQTEIYYQEGLELARQIGHTERISHLLLGLGTLAFYRGDYSQAEAYMQEGLVLARQIGYRERISSLLLGLGGVAGYRGDYAQAEAYMQEGLALARQISHTEQISTLLHNLGGVAAYRGDYAQAEAYFQEGLVLARQIGYSLFISATLQGLGEVAAYRGDYAQAEAHYQEGLVLARQIGHSLFISTLLQSLGEVAGYRGDYAQAEAHYQEGLVLARQIGYAERISALLQGLGEVAGYRGDYAQAEAYMQEGLALARQTGQRDRLSSVLSKQGELYLKMQQLDSAAACFREALEIASSKESRVQAAEAQYGLAQVEVALGNGDAARRLGEVSLNIFEKAGHGKASEVRGWLARIPLTNNDAEG